jgi:three-Cys-motif partner protein
MAGKQTKKTGSHFGGEWSKEKLTIIERYLGFYTTALKNTRVQKIYIDAFAGSGRQELKDGTTQEGSCLIALKYDFDEYYFIELDSDRIASLQEYIKTSYPAKINKVHFKQGDSNTEMPKVLASLTPYQRGVMFLDPYAMELKWSTLESAKNLEILDIWYLFPIMAVTRLMKKDGKIDENSKTKLNEVFGTDKWYDALYSEKPQMNLFGDVDMVKEAPDKLVEFIIEQLKTKFAYVAPKSKLLKNSNNAALFLLCFMMTNKSDKAIKLASTGVAGVFKSLETLKEGL